MQKSASVKEIQNHFQTPLCFIDMNSTFKRQTSPVCFSKLTTNEAHRLKRKMITEIDENQKQQNCALKMKNTHKENILPPSDSGKSKLSFTIKNRNKKKPFPNGKETQTLLFSASISRQHRFSRTMTVPPFQLQTNSANKGQLNRRKNNLFQTDDLQQSHFRKIRELGKGKFGTVWLVIHKKSNFICAMKIIKKQIVCAQKIEHQVAKQIRIHNTLRHINIIEFYGCFHDARNFFILTELATGEQVYSLLKKYSRISEREASKIIGETVQGLEVIHNLGFIHRDIKPQNLVLQFNTVKICDFGWAAECSLSEMRKSICGTPLYYPPEMVTNSSYNSLIDVWTLGLLAYELVVGRIPFKIWSQFDLPLILEQEVTFPEYIDLEDTTKNFILSCLTKTAHLRPTISMLKNHLFICKNKQIFSDALDKQLASIVSALI